MAIQIRPLTADDREAWLGLWQGYQLFYEARIDDEVTTLTWSRIIDPDGPIQGLGAESGGRLIGIAHYPFPPRSWAAADYSDLPDLFVAAAGRGRGPARVLTGAVGASAAAGGRVGRA